MKDIPYLSVDVEVWSEGGKTQVEKRVNETKLSEGDQSPRRPGFLHPSPGWVSGSPPNNTPPYYPKELVGEFVTTTIPDSAAEKNRPRSRSRSRESEDLEEDLLKIPIPFPPMDETNHNSLQDEDAAPSKPPPSFANHKPILFDPVSPLFRSNSTSSGVQRAMIMARLIGEPFDPADVITNSSFAKLARNHTVAGGNRAAAKTFMFDNSGERQSTDVEQASPSPKRGSASIESEAAIERRIPHSPPPPPPVVALNQFEPNRRNYDTPQFYPPRVIAPPLECIPTDDGRYSGWEEAAKVITETTSRWNEEAYRDGIKGSLSRSTPRQGTRSRANRTPGRPRNNSDSSIRRESDVNLPSDKVCEDGVFALKLGQSAVQTSNSSPASPTPLAPTSTEGGASDPVRYIDSKVFSFPGITDPEWSLGRRSEPHVMPNPIPSSDASPGADPTSCTNEPVVAFAEDSASTTTSDFLATDCLSERLDEQLQFSVNLTRGIYHSSLPLHSRDSTCPSDDGLPLVTHPVPDSSNLVALDAPACKRLISRSFSPQQVTSLIEAIFTSKDEIAMIRDLRGDDAQTFVDVINEVRSTSSPSRGIV